LRSGAAAAAAAVVVVIENSKRLLPLKVRVLLLWNAPQPLWAATAKQAGKLQL
jgi:hypothetical protein